MAGLRYGPPPIVLAGKKDLFIGGLPLPQEGNLPAYKQIEHEMREYLESNFGKVLSVRCPVRNAKQKAAFAFVSFKTPEGAQKMVAAVKPNTKNNISLTLPYAGPTPVNGYVDLIKNADSRAAYGMGGYGSGDGIGLKFVPGPSVLNAHMIKPASAVMERIVSRTAVSKKVTASVASVEKATTAPDTDLNEEPDLFIGDLPFPAELDLVSFQQIEQQLTDFLEKNFGPVSSVRCPVRKASQKRAFAFVTFESPESRRKLLDAVRPDSKNNIDVDLPYCGQIADTYVDLVKNKSARAKYGWQPTKTTKTVAPRLAKQPSKPNQDGLQAKMADYLENFDAEESLNCELLLVEMPDVLKELCNTLKKEPGCKLKWTRLASMKGFEEKSKRLEAQSVLLEMTYKSIIDMHVTSESCQVVLLKPDLFQV